MRLRLPIALLLLLSGTVMCLAQRLTREEYLEKYSALAVREMIEFGVPASITLAQACLESSNGNSFLAVEANNHFGIKCHGVWGGKTIRHEAETGPECFRVYESPDESFSDHSRFLRSRPRYDFLFELDVTDYKAWAYGLSEAGYATDKEYPAKLIKIIEDNELYRFDVLPQESQPELPLADSCALYNNGVAYVVAKEGDSYSSIAGANSLFKNEILSFNDLEKEVALNEGDTVYVQEKRSSAAAIYETHTVERGETQHSIAQKYAMRQECLAKYNNLRKRQKLFRGRVLRLQDPDKN